MEEFVEKLIKRLKKHYNEVRDMYLKGQGNFALLEGKMRGIEDANAIIVHLAKEHNGGWIPCSERLPEETECYLVTWRDRVTCKNYVEIVEYDAGSQEWLDCICQAGLLGYDIIAWQPLPAPYQPKGE